jgi:hypothetical protein
MNVTESSVRVGLVEGENESASPVIEINTYALLALSMVPTVIGAWLGVAMGFVIGLARGFKGARLTSMDELINWTGTTTSAIFSNKPL